MTNYEKHKDEMIKHNFAHNQCSLKRKLFSIDCGKTRCNDCMKLAEEWLEAEYVEPEVDWNKAPMGTPVMVWNKDDYKYKRTLVAYDENRKHKFITLDETNKDIGFWANAELIEVDDESNTND